MPSLLLASPEAVFSALRIRRSLVWEISRVLRNDLREDFRCILMETGSTNKKRYRRYRQWTVGCLMKTWEATIASAKSMDFAG